MSQDNGIIRIGRKGKKKFAFGDNPPFEVDVVESFQKWIIIDDEFRQECNIGNAEGSRRIPPAEVPRWHQAAVEFVTELVSLDRLIVGKEPEISITIAEALDFLARLREEYDKLVVFFQPKSQDEPESPDTSERVSTEFSEEPMEEMEVK